MARERERERERETERQRETERERGGSREAEGNGFQWPGAGGWVRQTCHKKSKLQQQIQWKGFRRFEMTGGRDAHSVPYRP